MTSPGLSEMFAYHATTMANTIRTSLLVFSRKVGRAPVALLAELYCGVVSAGLENIVGKDLNA